MALLALVEPWRSGELGLVLVVMAVEAAREFDVVERVFSLREMALRALECRVLALQRILRRGMSLHIEFRRLPSIDIVTGGAFPGVGTLCELTVVGIPVAVGAFGERERLFEIAIGVAGAASYGLMLAQ